MSRIAIFVVICVWLVSVAITAYAVSQEEASKIVPFTVLKGIDERGSKIVPFTVLNGVDERATVVKAFVVLCTPGGTAACPPIASKKMIMKSGPGW